MKKKEKLNIALSLSLGIFAAICGIIRTYELQGLSRVTDYSYGTVSLVLWSASELLITIICANIPMLRPLYSKSASSAQDDTPGPYNSHPTIGSNRFGGGRKKGEDTWTELDDDITMKSQLGAEKERGHNRASIAGGKLKFEDSDESILRESREDGIRVTEDILVTAESGSWSKPLHVVDHERQHAF